MRIFRQSAERIDAIPFLKHTLIAYLALSITDIFHHLHVVHALGISSGMHAAIIGFILLPLSLIAIQLFLIHGNRIFINIFFAIAALAIIFPGLYHGGWHHFIKIAAYLQIDGESTHISVLLPGDNVHYWIYEISGVLELLLSFVCMYYAFKYFSKVKKTSNRSAVAVS